VPNKRQDAVYKQRREVWRDIVYDMTSGVTREEVARARLAKLEEWRNNPWAFKTGRDVPTEEWPDGKPIIWTPDERDDEAPVKSYPATYDYLFHLTKERWGKERFFFANKARQLYVSTDSLLDIFWYISFREEREVIVSKIKEEAAIKLINDKIRVPFSRMPAWVRTAITQTPDPRNVITCTETGSTVTAVAQNFAEGDARGITGSLVFVDEAAFQPMFPKIYRAILPMAARLWAVSTANIGNPGAALFKQLIFEGVDTRVEEDEEVVVER